jgi:hypothetical protein
MPESYGKKQIIDKLKLQILELLISRANFFPSLIIQLPLISLSITDKLA